MHRPPPEHAPFLKIVAGGLVLIVLALGTTGCTDPATGIDGYSPFGTIDTIATTEAGRDSALRVLTAMERTAFDSAFVHLDAYALTRHVRTEQMDSTGRTTAYRSLTLRYEADAASGTVLRADSAGAFRGGGALSVITPERQPADWPGNLSAQALPDQPAFVAPRTREAYRYALARDTLRDGTDVHVVEAKARSYGTGADQNVRFARLTIIPSTNQLIGLVVVRASSVLLFEETSQVAIRLRRAPGHGPNASDGSTGTWVPHLTRFRAVVDVPFRAPRQFRTVSAYYAYEQ